MLSILCFGALSFGNKINILNKSYIGDQIKDFNIDLVNGDINGRNLNKIDDMESISGSINIEGNELLKESQLETIVGRIDLKVNKIIGRNNISTIFGRIKVNN